MSARSGVIAVAAVVLGLSACSRGPAVRAPQAAAPESATAPVVLAGGPAEAPIPTSDAPATEPESSAPASALAEAPEAAAPPADPLEPVNRKLYAVDAAIGHVISHRPKVLRTSGPHTRTALNAARNALNNLGEPSVAANDVLQRKLGRGAQSLVRFVINSTVGVAGLFDVAERLGMRRHDNDLDQTLATYRAPAGPYLYLPVAGPTTLRAVIAAAAEGYLYPPHWLHLAATVGGALKGVGYAKLASGAITRADGGPSSGPDGYHRARAAYYAAQVGPGTGGQGGGRATSLAIASEQRP